MKYLPDQPYTEGEDLPKGPMTQQEFDAAAHVDLDDAVREFLDRLKDLEQE